VRNKKAHREGSQDEMDKIVDKIIDIVCHQCVPNGRFLEKILIPVDGEDDSIELGEGDSVRISQIPATLSHQL
jgi:hypothetical protein